MENMSLDQIIKNNKKSGSGGRARRLSTDSPSKTSSPRKLRIRSKLKPSSGSPRVKFTARLDSKDTSSPSSSSSSSRGGRKTNTTTPTTTTTTSTSTSSLPPLKITIQNNKATSTTTSSRNDRDRSSPPIRDGNGLPRIKITKSVDRVSSRPIIRSLGPSRSSSPIVGGSNNNNNSIRGGGGRNSSFRGGNNNNNNNSFTSGRNNDNSRFDENFGNGPSLFERNSFRNNNSNNNNHSMHGPAGKNLQLFTGSRLNISNLHHAISENDLRVLFDSVGDIKQIKVHYDHSGRSDGTGFVIFSRHNDAMTALKKYNGAQLDGLALRITAGPSLQEDVRNIF